MEDWMFLLQNLHTDKLFLLDTTTLTMNDHDERSMRGQNKILIKKRLMANAWAIKNISLSKKQIRILNGYSFLFCAIHSYVDNKKKDTLIYLIKAVEKIGCTTKIIILSIKLIIGYKNMQRLK